MTSPFDPFLEDRGFVVLDGGLATTLELGGWVLDTDLWSAELLRREPEAIARAHRAFLDAGADCVTTAAYQASFPGLLEAGLDRREATELLLRSSELAVAARDAFVADAGPGAEPHPLVAASVGPYGAYLADGSEYDGRYGASESDLDRFHRERLSLLASSGIDVVALETVPSVLEVGVLLDLLDATTSETWAWLSVSCRDGAHLNDGTPIEAVVAMCEGRERIAGVGVNCTAPGYVGELIRRARGVTDLPLVAYPNSGERWDAVVKRWDAPELVEDAAGRAGDARGAWLHGVLEARDAGARVLGGCCRVAPDDIAMLRRTLERRD